MQCETKSRVYNLFPQFQTSLLGEPFSWWGITSLKLAIERSKAFNIIQGKSCERRRNFEKRFEKGKDRDSHSHDNGDSHSNGKFVKDRKEKKKNSFEKGAWKGASTECWQ